MVQNIKEGIIRNRSLLFFALAVAVLFGGMLFVSHAPGVEGKAGGPTVLSCTNNTPNGGICVSNSQCQSGLCLGVNGVGNPPACTAENVGTCQMLTLNGDTGGIQDYVPSMSDGGGDPGDGGGGKGEECTTGFPLPPTSVSGSFSNSYTNPGINNLNITIPPAANNGTGEEHQVIVILNSQAPEDVSVPMWVDYPPVIPSGYSHTAALSAPNVYNGQPIKVAVRNFDSCQGLWSEWRESNTITQSGGGSTSGTCNGNVAPNSILCSGDNAGFTGSISYDLVPSCSVPTGSLPKCERECDIGYVYSNDSCIPAPTYSCTGTLPANSILCSGDGSGLTNDTPYTTVGSCSSPSGSAPKCEAKCQGNTEPINGQCVENEIGNIFGYAWSDNVGWIQMNSCFDEDQDGVPDSPCSAEAPGQSGGFGVSVSNGGTMGGSGALAGHAWSDAVGWINFGGLTGPDGVSSPAELDNLDNNVGAITGWARVITGGTTPGFDGWIKLSDNGFFPTGIGHEDGDAGLTYNRKTARIVGSMWGGEALGWIRFNDPVNGYHKVTYGIPALFDYSMTALPTGFTSWTVPGETHNVTSTINLTLTSGKTETVSLSVQVNSPSGATIPLTASLPVNANCKPDCQKTLSINVAPDTTPGMYSVVVKGQSSIAEKEVAIPVFVPSLDLASCKAAGGPPYLVNNPVTWIATPAAVDPLNPLTYSWEGTNVPDSPSVPGTNTNFIKTYATTGIKEMFVTATNVGGVSTVTKCTNSVVVVAQPNTNEF